MFVGQKVFNKLLKRETFKVCLKNKVLKNSDVKKVLENFVYG